jgi:hypothetical protein
MGWMIYFWAVAALLLLPLPFKLFEYATGRDTSPTAVKVEEMANAAFFAVGLAALHGWVYGHVVGTAGFWRAWVVIAVAVSLAGLAWSPKLRYADSVLGTRRLRVVMAVGTLLLLPMLVAIWRYSVVIP